MLKAGYMEDWQYHESLSGTPQGGVVTPPTQWATSVSMSRWVIGVWNCPGAANGSGDMIGSMIVSCCVLQVGPGQRV